MGRASAFALLAAAGAASALDDGSAEFYRQSAVLGASNATMQRVLLTDFAKTTGAVCLDGTPGVFYYRKGTGSGANKWYIHHQGGGWCESLDDCLMRSHGSLGSSKDDGATTVQAGGYFSTEETVNPLMWNWNSVYIRYCDGGSFSGANATVTEYKGASLHFRGSLIRQGVVATLKRDHGLTRATDAVISGCSAGGLATYLHTDQWCDALPGAKCVGLPDSGFFLDYQAPKTVADTTIPGNYHDGLSWVFNQMNATSGINQDCIKARSKAGDAYLCIFAEHTSVYTHSPLFAMQSEYDSWQMSHVLPKGYAAADVQTLGDNITSRMQSDLFKPHPESGAFLDSCVHHCGAWNSISIDGQLVSQAIKTWYEGIGQAKSKKLWRQGKPYECTECCKP
eukprot:TRINITY_DN781_c0_g1_i1.p1 TRINITY_DN781_c0_g1~~TRINITY_DN781_c0_g1_i1.p1  ORF type:complete len:395 (+),score=140.66 TRINITY_DN781_c0_g1_i1:63-1247(+)